MLPIRRMSTFFVNAPFNGKIRETKRKLKITSVTKVSKGSGKKYEGKREKVVPISNPKTR